MFTIHLFKVSKKILLLFNASVTTTGNHLEAVPVYIMKSLDLLLQVRYTELITNYRYNGINPLVHGTSI